MKRSPRSKAPLVSGFLDSISKTLGTVERGLENKEHIQRPSTTTFPGGQCYDCKRFLNVSVLKNLSAHLEKVGPPPHPQSSDSINLGLEKTIFNFRKHSREVLNQEILGVAKCHHPVLSFRESFLQAQAQPQEGIPMKKRTG